MKIRAAVLEEFGRPLEVQEVDLAEPKAGEVSSASSRAASVIRTCSRHRAPTRPATPAVLGHEGAGVVEKVGDGVASLAPGTTS